ncbi:MAG: glycosyltransferase [Planctomycetes bacterium]|nr:glycosyltransferase [Planctomycetota bacterium]
MPLRSVDCSVIIPTRTRRAVLARTLKSLAELPDHGFEVIVVDNGSTDGTLSLRSEFPAVHWIELGENRSSSARNAGAESAKGRVLLMLDDDSWPDPGVIGKVVRRMSDRPELGAIACRVLLADSDGRHDAGGVPGIFFNCGGAVRRDAFLDVGGFPTDYDYYVEEYDLCCRLWQHGLCVEPHGDLIVHHRRTLENRDNNRMLRFLVRNNIALWRKFAPPALRDDLIASTVERYARVARKENASAGFEQGLQESKRHDNGTSDEVPLTLDQFEHLFGIKTARRVLREWADKRAIRRIAVWSRGKGCEQIVGLANSLGFHIHAVYDSPESIGHDRMWRGINLRACDGFNVQSVDGLVVGSLSPGVAEDISHALGQKYESLPIITLAPWLHMPSVREASVLG